MNNFKNLEKLINTINPDIIIHASALTDVRLYEKNVKKCNLVNFQQTQNIVNIYENRI